MQTQLFIGTSSKLELRVDVRALERLKQERDSKLRRLHEFGGKELRTIEVIIQSLLNNLRAEADCWIWHGRINNSGYGIVSIYGRSHRVHRFIYWLTNASPLPEMVCHHCDNRICSRPNHLFAGNGTINAIDRDIKGRTAKGETHYRSKLSVADVQLIRTTYRFRDATNDSVALGKRFNMHPSAILGIIHNANWKHC